MMGGITLGEARIELENGTILGKWSQFSCDSQFMTPTDGWSFSFGTDAEWQRIRDLMSPQQKCSIWIEGAMQCSGWIDRLVLAAAADSGFAVEVSGRDFMAPLCDANIHPDTRIKNRKLYDLIMDVVDQVYGHDPTPVNIQWDNRINRDVLSSSIPGAGGASTTTTYTYEEQNGYQKALSSAKAAAANGASAASIGYATNIVTAVAAANASYVSPNVSSKPVVSQTVIENCSPHPNEGAFEFLSRNLKRFGLWLWASADGGIVIGTPNYEQPPSAVLNVTKGTPNSHVKHVTYTWDATQVPSSVIVRGRSGGKAWDKKAIMGRADNPGSRIHKPMYLLHDQAETNEQATNFAWQEMSRLKQSEIVYEIDVCGFRNPETGNVYAVDTTARVVDEAIGLDAVMWCAGRTFNRSASGGTTTHLRYVPLYTYIFNPDTGKGNG